MRRLHRGHRSDLEGERVAHPVSGQHLRQHRGGGQWVVNLCADDYALYLVDEENCTDSAFVSITEPDPLLFDIGPERHLHRNERWRGHHRHHRRLGETAWEFVEDVDVLNLFEGEYSVSAADTAGCTADSTFLVAADIVTDMVVEIFTTPVTCWQTRKAPPRQP